MTNSDHVMLAARLGFLLIVFRAGVMLTEMVVRYLRQPPTGLQP